MILLFSMLALAQDPLSGLLGDPTPRSEEEAIAELRPTARWCVAPGEQLFPWEREWCGAIPPECPGMEARCAEEQSQGCADQDLELPDSDLSAPLAWTAQVVQALAIAIAVALVLAAVIAFLRLRPPPDPELPAPLPARLEKSSPDPEAAIQTGPDPLGEARAAFARGEAGLAVMLLRAAVLAVLEQRGRLVLHPSRTDREYVRELADKPEGEPLREVARVVEQQRYAGVKLSLERWERALAAAAKLLAPLLLFVLCTHAAARVLDHKLIVPLFSSMGYEIRGGELPEDYGGELLITSAADTDQLAAIVAWVTEGNRAIVVVPEGGELPAGLSAGASTGPAQPMLGDSPVRLPHKPYELVGSAAPILYSDDDKVIATALRLGDSSGMMAVVALPGLLDDASLLHVGNLRLLRWLVEAMGGGPILVLAEAEPPSPSPLAALARAGLLPLLGHGLVAFGLAAWWRGRRFAAPRNPPEHRRRDFREHLQAVAGLYRAGEAQHLSFAAYATWALAWLRQRTRADDAELAVAVARRSGLPLERVERVLRNAREAANRPDGSSQEAELFMQEELWEIIEGMKKGGGSPSTNSPSASGGWKRK
jgi:Domain of unknown function (DUF4129)